jgi:hypothetical protein
MAVPLERVFRRGAVFLWTTYAALDDPALSGQTKAKFIVMLSSSVHDDPYYFILTTSEKAKHATHPHKTDLVEIVGGTYSYLPVDTILDAGEAGQLAVGREEFAALYDAGEIVHRGWLSNEDIALLMTKIMSSLRVSRRFKQMMGTA